MVEFEEIKDEQYTGAETVVDDDDDEWSDESDDGEDDEKEIASETLIDRIVALKDIIPARQRDAIARTLSKAYSYGTIATFIGGKAAYVVITSVLMLGIPYALTLEEDRMIAEQERQMQMSQDMSGVSLYSQ
jgi:import receptor subunit TOM22